MRSKWIAWKRPTERALINLLRNEVTQKRKDGKALEASDLSCKYLRDGQVPPLPSWEDVVLRAGGRTFRLGR